MTEPPDASRSPSALDTLQALAVQEQVVTPTLRHVEIYTMGGLLSLFWHGGDAEHAVLMCGGAMGGVLGPADGLYHELGEYFAGHEVATIRVGYRRPNDLTRCVDDLLAAAELATRGGTEAFVTVGHSFGGAVALRAGIELADRCRGVVTLATQSAGCEDAARLGSTPLLLLHGDRDELLPPEASAMVHMLAGTGELVLLPGAGHLLNEAAGELRMRCSRWILAALAGALPE